jgi:hypothetical protein
VNAGPDNQQSADLVKTSVAQLGGLGLGQTYYDATAFQDPAVNRQLGPHFGNTGRNFLRNPGVFNTDLSVSRSFPIKERVKIEFRTDCFNITNTPKFTNLTTTDVTSGTFLQYTSTLTNSTAVNTERQFRFGLKVLF